jgi:hypothetical protein
MSKNFLMLPVTAETKKQVDLAKEWYKQGHTDDTREITYDFIILRMAKVYRGLL